MATYAKVLLSGSTSGRPIQVRATTSTGDTIHTAVAGASDIDEIHLWAQNNHTSDVALTIEWGGVVTGGASGLDIWTFTVPTKDGWFPIAEGFPLNGGLLVTAFAGTTDVVSIQGYVNRITA